MKNLRIKISLFLNYFVFAMLLNSVGVVILQVSTTYGIEKTDASILEAYKDLSIAIASFFIASSITRIGYKRAMLIGLAIVTIMCLLMPSMPSFVMNKCLFAVVGVAFALIKVSVYSTIGLITENEKEHASLMNFIESFFMVGILVGMKIFSLFSDTQNTIFSSWLYVYYFLAALSFLALVLLWGAALDESSLQVKAQSNDSFAAAAIEFLNMFKLLAAPLVLVFILSAFTFVFIEQGFSTWLPTFNFEVLKIPKTLSIELGGLMAGAAAIGRFSAGIVMRRFHWLGVLSMCLIAAAGLLLIAMPMARGVDATNVQSWLDLPSAAFFIPMIGFFISPIYPAINSLILNRLPQTQHASMAGLTVVFSALGGTIGSRIVATIFENIDGLTAFYFILIPISVLLGLLVYFHKIIKNTKIA